MINHSDLLKLKHLIVQTTKVDVKGTLLTIMGEMSHIKTLKDVQNKKLNPIDIQIIRQLYDSVRAIERSNIEYEAEKWRLAYALQLNKAYVPMNTDVM